MPKDISNKQRIAKNTVLLYARMFLTIIVGLYTSRVVLSVLGVSDYGVYNVVGGIVAMLSFLNFALTAASQRFISFSLGKGSLDELRNVFSTSVSIHALLAFILFLLAETAGLWFVNTQLNIDESRMAAANWVYQFSILTFMTTIISVPYNSCIVAHERMKAFAYISILEALLKLAIAFCLYWGGGDKLILYGALVFGVALVIRICYGIYCKRNFAECHYRFVLDKGLFRRMFSFAGWSILGSMGFSFKDQASNVILNIFFGTTVNAARAISLQVSAIINSFSANFTIALNPQITKQYASGNITESQSLVYSGARYSFYLLMMVAIPFIINIDYVLKLWLGHVPEYTSIFTIVSLLAALLYAMSNSVTTALQATGKIMAFQIGIFILMMAELPAAWILLKAGMPPYVAVYPTVVTNFMALFFRMALLKKFVPSYSLRTYTFSVFFRCAIVFAISFMISATIKGWFDDTLLGLLVNATLSVIVCAVVIYLIGATKTERASINKVAAKLVAKLRGNIKT